ncbi:MAG TPA: carboxylesterase/lipase family protein [Pseudomonadales bacterium]|nr:carboxylesterase/lipase family protein [Pseudomonadales bacterium]
MQADGAPISREPNSFEMSEDSLFLNIFTPLVEGNKRPVLVWIHGGSFLTGTGNGYVGTQLSSQGDVVVVSINYRLGILGFLDLSGFDKAYAGSASNGIRDQILALKWVHDNIGDYGGDADNVTIFGESSGGTSVASLIAAPSADGLYHKAIIHSGAPVHAPPPDLRESLADQLDVTTDQLLVTLRSMTAQEIIESQGNIQAQFGGIVDGTVVTRSSLQAIADRGSEGVPIIVGSNKDEGTLLSFLTPRFAYDMAGPFIADLITAGKGSDAYIEALKSAYPDDSSREHYERIWNEMFRMNAVKVAEQASTTGAGSWVYRFDLPVQNSPLGTELGATHGAEIFFTFNSFADSDIPYYDKADPKVSKLAETWSNTVIQFARMGDPNGAGLPEWPKYQPESRQTLILDGNPRLLEDVDEKDRKRWQALGLL